MTSTMPVNMVDNVQQRLREEDGKAFGDADTPCGNSSASAEVRRGMIVSIVSLFERDGIYMLFPPFSACSNYFFVKDGCFKDICGSGKISQSSYKVQWLELLALPGSCNGCNGLPHTAVGGYSSSGHD